MPPAPMAETISYGPRRTPLSRDMLDCQRTAAIIESFKNCNVSHPAQLKQLRTHAPRSRECLDIHVRHAACTARWGGAMLRLSDKQRAVLADKIGDAANVAAGAMVFSQFVSPQPISS